jgi:hypothetical protein
MGPRKTDEGITMRIPPTRLLIPQSGLASRHGASRTASYAAVLLGPFKRAGAALRGLERMPAGPAEQSADPAPPDASADAAAVRELGYQHMRSDPGFAADLIAAANRHEAKRIGKPSPDDCRPQRPCRQF